MFLNTYIHTYIRMYTCEMVCVCLMCARACVFSQCDGGVGGLQSLLSSYEPSLLCATYFFHNRTIPGACTIPLLRWCRTRALIWRPWKIDQSECVFYFFFEGSSQSYSRVVFFFFCFGLISPLTQKFSTPSPDKMSAYYTWYMPLWAHTQLPSFLMIVECGCRSVI